MSGSVPNDRIHRWGHRLDPAEEGTAGGVRGVGVLGTLALVATLGVSPVGIERSVAATAAADLSAFGDCRAFTAYHRAQAEREVTAYGLGGGPVLYRGAPMADNRAGNVPSAAPAPGEAVGNGPTGTNVQERGVDEPDVAKIDGTRVLTLNQGRLVLVDTAGGKPKLRDTLAFGADQFPSELFVLPGRRALVIGSAWEHTEPAAGKRFAPDHQPGTSKVVLTLVDTAGGLRVLRTATVTGSYVSARLSDGVARVVLTSQPRIVFPSRGEGGPDALALTRNRQAVRSAKAADFLPERQILDAAGKVLERGPAYGCTQALRPDRPAGLGLLSVLTLDTARGNSMFHRAGGTGICANGDIVYASTKRMYVATTEGGWGWTGPTADTASRRPADQRRTAIHAFDAIGRGSTRYLGSGAVPGYALGRWAFSEHRGFLRVATTTGEPWAPPENGTVSQSSVFVLDETSDGLRRVGSVSGLGKTERIRGIRWFGDLAAIVTFRQTDPLYLVDLAKPNRPRVRGELKIPGYSAYLHPTGNGGLFGIGQDADAQGRLIGLLAQQFDVSDPTRPTRTDRIGLGRGYTTVEGDSRAFTYLTSRRLVVIPAWVNQKVSCPPNAACVADGPRGDGFVGEITVPAAIGILVGTDGQLTRAGRFIGDSTIHRVLPIGDRLVAITENAVVLLRPDGLRPAGSVRLTPKAPQEAMR